MLLAFHASVFSRKAAVLDMKVARQQLIAAIEASISDGPDWTDWAKMPSWTAEEAAALTLGLSPHCVTQHAHIAHPFIRRFRMVCEMIRRAVATGELANVDGAISPEEYLKWASHYSLELPPELQSEIRRVKRFATGTKDRPLGNRERETHLKLIAALTMAGWGYSPNSPNPNYACIE